MNRKDFSILTLSVGSGMMMALFISKFPNATTVGALGFALVIAPFVAIKFTKATYSVGEYNAE